MVDLPDPIGPIKATLLARLELDIDPGQRQFGRAGVTKIDIAELKRAIHPAHA